MKIVLNPYIDSCDKLIVKPGDYYELRVETEFGMLTGYTRVPHSINIITPQSRDLVRDSTHMNILWNRNEFAHGYVVNLLGPPVMIQFSEGNYYTYRSTRCFCTTDTSLVIQSDYLTFPHEPPLGEYIEENLRCTLKIMALDENFKNHLFDGYDICGITGGYGLFGSATVDSVDFFVIE